MLSLQHRNVSSNTTQVSHVRFMGEREKKGIGAAGSGRGNQSRIIGAKVLGRTFLFGLLRLMSFETEA